jgi:hypothetical protein
LLVCAGAIALGGCGSIEDSTAARNERAGEGRAGVGGEARAMDAGMVGGPTLPNAVARYNASNAPDSGVPRGRVQPVALEWGTDGGPMVSADAGFASAEIAWLVTHIDDNADRAGPAGPPNIRALASYQAEGVRAVIPLFRVGDARRVPHARRVIELLAQRACRGTADALAPRRLVAWIESGSPELPRPAQVADAGPPSAQLPWPWARAVEAPWPREGLDRMQQWADRALFCDAPHEQ